MWSTGCVNKCNFHCLAKENSWQLRQWPLHSVKVAVWSAMPFFRGDRNPFLSRWWRHYRNYSSRLLHQLLRCLLVSVLGLCLSTTKGSNGLLQGTWLMFLAHAVSQNGDVRWPAITRVLSLVNTLFGWSSRARCYVSCLRIIAKLKHITEIIRTMQRLWYNK